MDVHGQVFARDPWYALYAFETKPASYARERSPVTGEAGERHVEL